MQRRRRSGGCRSSSCRSKRSTRRRGEDIKYFWEPTMLTNVPNASMSPPVLLPRWAPLRVKRYEKPTAQMLRWI
jgi:hypothetical protein